MPKEKTTNWTKLAATSGGGAAVLVAFIFLVVVELFWHWQRSRSGPALMYAVVKNSNWLIISFLLFLWSKRYLKRASHQDKESLLCYNRIVKNKESYIAWTAIILVALVSLYIWYSSAHMANWIWLNTSNDAAWQANDLFTVDSIYNRAFQKIVMFGGFVFSSAFLLLKIKK